MWLADFKLSILWQVCQIGPCLASRRGQRCTTGPSSALCCEKCFTFLVVLDRNLLILVCGFGFGLVFFLPTPVTCGITGSFGGQHVTHELCVGKPWSFPCCCRAELGAGSWARDLHCGFKRPSGDQSCSSIKSWGHLSTADTSLTAFAPAVIHRHLRKPRRKIRSLCTRRWKAVARGLAMLSSLQLPEVGDQDPWGLPAPLRLAEISLPFNWHPVSPGGRGWLPPRFIPRCLQSSARPSAVPHRLWLVILV